ncbi:hypothetical protein L2649_12180, partial [Thermoactinomyces vulgaris]|jgi:hypothetical protein|uniref:hypothetical protein n=2 Tax=Thermoactinomyces vulgaris TaxID=2026 RepID=UPI001F1ADB18
LLKRVFALCGKFFASQIIWIPFDFVDLYCRLILDPNRVSLVRWPRDERKNKKDDFTFLMSRLSDDDVFYGQSGISSDVYWDRA